jgi:putative peptidoglycan lipid II flippase
VNERQPPAPATGAGRPAGGDVPTGAETPAVDGPALGTAGGPGRRGVVRGVAAAAVLISVLTVVSRIAGFGRTLVLTNTVPGCVGGIYTAANTIPNIVFEVVAGGALASLVVPMLAGGVTVGDAEQVRRTASALIGWTLVVLLPLAAAVMLLAEPIARLVLGANTRCDGAVPLAARFLLVFAPQVVFYGLTVVLTGVLQAHRRFAGPAVAPLVSSVVVATGYVLFAALGGTSSATDLPPAAELALGLGTTLGVAALALTLLPPLLRLHLGLRPALRFPVGVGARVRRLAVAGVLTLAGQQLTAGVAIRLAGDGTAGGTQLVYTAAMTVFLLPWGALAVPLATSVYPVLTGAAETRDEPGFRRALAPVAVVTVVAAAVAAAVLIAVSGPLARVFYATSATSGSAGAMRTAIVGFAPGLLGYSLLALLTRALYARGLWRAPTGCVVGGWLLAIVADVVLSRVLPVGDRALALAAGHSLGVTVAGIGLVVATSRSAGRGALAGVARTGLPALAAAAVGAAAGLGVAGLLGADPLPRGGVLAAIGTGAVVSAVVLVVAAAVMMVTARRPLLAAVRGLRATGRQEVHGG